MRRVLIIGARSNLSKVLAAYLPNATLISSCDIEVLPDVIGSSGPVDIIYNSFVKSSELRNFSDPELYSHYSIARLAKFVSLCRENENLVNSVIYTSSASVYGNNASAAEHDHGEIRGLYPAMKLSCELFIENFLKDVPVKVIIARVFNMYGGDDSFSIISKVARAIDSGAPLAIANRGVAIRDFICIEDVAAAYAAILRSGFEGVINVGSGVGTSVSEVIRVAEQVFGKRLNVINYDSAEVQVSVASIEKLDKILINYRYKCVVDYFRCLSTNGGGV